MNHLIAEAEKHVVNLLNTHLKNSFVYHNVTHTQNVVKNAIELADLAKIDTHSKSLLVISAWFHDTGFVKSNTTHEVHSAAYATAFLKEHHCSEEDIKLVSDLILATTMGFKPKTQLEKFIRDADCAHVANKNFEDVTLLLKKELELTNQKQITDIEWLEQNITFFTQEHKFNSDLAVSLWEKGKSKNLAKLLKTYSKITKDTSRLKQKKDELKFKKHKIEIPERGIETMFRVTLKNHITLSNIADTKANILLSVNAIIVSLVLANLLPKLDNPSNQYLIYPTLVFVLFTVASIILSVLATRPNITRGKFTKEDVANQKVNLLFFGNFHKMKLNEFEWAMGEMMKDKDYLYSTLKKDLYFLGLVLNKKYKILRITYTVFMVGIICSVLAFAIAFKYAGY
ncbi:Pycsar system effector family protein [Lacinutrix gracilariae]|uniref:Pycsar system effector family protein n=1 Tax=Lacinutrix gracilariae TaxID=1747198 RepID=A0ABW5K349_9FLAO